MSDPGMGGGSAPPSSGTGVASQSPAPAPSSPQAGVPIEQNPTNIPTPVGSQAPAKSQAEARRNSIQEAFRKSRDPEWQKSRPGPAQASRTHNKPPEPLANEPPRRVEGKDKGESAAPFDLKKRPPSEEPNQRRQRSATDQRERGDGGRFAPRQSANTANTANTANAAFAPNAAPYNPASNVLPMHAPHREPPPRMNNHAKSEWHTAPESVRGEFGRMHREFAHAHQRYGQFKQDSEAFASIKPYHDLARRHGTTLDRALQNYVSIEDKLRDDPVGGLDLIVNNMNLRTADGRRIGFRDIAWHVLNQTPEQVSLMQANNAQAAQTAQLQQIRQQQAALAQQQQRMQYEDKYRQSRSWVDRFAETHPRLDELGPVIEREFKLGFDLEQAYQRACMLVPAARAAGGNQQSYRSPDRSIHGAPAGGQTTNGATRRKSTSVRSSVADAIAQVRGQL